MKKRKITNSEIVQSYCPIVKFITEILGPHCEVVLHDYATPDHSVVAIENGHLSGRQIGSPVSDMGMKRLRKNTSQVYIANYISTAATGKRFRSASYAIRNFDGELIGSLCVNIDIAYLDKAAEFLNFFTHIDPIEENPQEGESAKAGDRPGVTRGKQWITVDQGLELLDTPGILWPKFEDETIGLHLAFTGAVRDAIMDVETLACHLIQLLAQRKPESLAARFKLVPEEGMDGWALLEAGARKRGFLISGGEVDLERMAHILLDEFRGGKMGRITLELPEDLERGADPSGVP